jgi:hypothetical protein
LRSVSDEDVEGRREQSERFLTDFRSVSDGTGDASRESICL